MSLSINVSRFDILKDPAAALFKCNMLIHQAKSEMEQQIKGRDVNFGDFRGTITALDKTQMTVTNKQGVQKSVQLTPQRTVQLFKDETQR